MNVKVEKRGYSLHVFVTLNSRSSAEGNKSCNTGHVLKWLAENKAEYNIVNTIQAPSRHLHNASQRLSGEWIFGLPKPAEKPVKPVVVKQKAPPARKKKTTRTKKRQKTAAKKEE